MDPLCERCSPCSKRKRDISITRDKEFRVKKAMLTKLVTPLLALDQSLRLVNAFQACCAFVSKIYKLPFLVTSGLLSQVKVLTCMKNSIKFVCFSPVSLPHISLIFRPSWRPKEIRGRLFLLCIIYLLQVCIYICTQHANKPLLTKNNEISE